MTTAAGTGGSPSSCVELYLTALRDLDKEALRLAWHLNGLKLSLSSMGTLEKESAATLAHIVDDCDESSPVQGCALLSLTLISGTCACAKIRFVQSAKTVTEFVTMLKETRQGWKIISSVSSVNVVGESERKISPTDFAEVSTAMWEGYVAAGRACDSEAMKRVFHPDCRLTFASDDAVAITIIAADEFYNMVGHRWSMEPHVPFAHLKNDNRIADADSLVAIDFAGPDVAMVILNIGYPPFLYHDVLLLLRLAPQPPSQRPGGSSTGGWWIVAKSSDHEPWMENERRV